MKIDNLKNYERNWIVGNFEPSLFKTSSVDIGILFCKKGESGDGHFHLNHVEYNLIINGSVKINDDVLTTGDIFIYEPYDKSNVIFLDDTTLLVIKNPSTKNDKFY
jgi:hypothetical protein